MRNTDRGSNKKNPRQTKKLALAAGQVPALVLHLPWSTQLPCPCYHCCHYHFHWLSLSPWLLTMIEVISAFTKYRAVLLHCNQSLFHQFALLLQGPHQPRGLEGWASREVPKVECHPSDPGGGGAVGIEWFLSPISPQPYLIVLFCHLWVEVWPYRAAKKRRILVNYPHKPVEEQKLKCSFPKKAMYCLLWFKICCTL